MTFPRDRSAGPGTGLPVPDGLFRAGFATVEIFAPDGEAMWQVYKIAGPGNSSSTSACDNPPNEYGWAMDRSVQDIDPREVERTIRDGFRLLRFPAGLERRFEAASADQRCRTMIRQNYIALIIYHCFLYSDYRSIGDAFTIDLIMHFMVMTPATIALNYVLARRPAVWVRECVEILALLVLALTIAIVVSASVRPDRDIVLSTMSLVVLFAIMIQRIRFWYLIPASTLIGLLYVSGLTLIMPASSDRLLMSASLLIGIILFSLFGAYNLEHQERMGYLLRLRDRLRNQELEVITLRDALTGIGNRRALDAALARLAPADAATGLRMVAILLMDIDHFKMFNDRNGHQEGDLCLTRVAGLISGGVRRSEGEAYRYGGEEFLVLLHDTDPDVALGVAERIRSRVAGARIPSDPAADAFVTISVGVAFGRLGHDATPEGLVAAADGALYAAKREGRNRVSRAGPPDRTAASVPQAAPRSSHPPAGPDDIMGLPVAAQA